MGKYRQKPIAIDAIRFNPQSFPWSKGVQSWDKEQARPRDMSWGYITNLRGNRIHIRAGDWIVTSLTGEIHIYTDEEFQAAYESVPLEEQ